MSFNSKYTGQEVEGKLDELQNITATDQEFRYKDNKVYHTGNKGEIFPTSHSLILSNSSNGQTITVEGDKNTFYPVHITFKERNSQLPIRCWVLKALGSISPDWEGNHSSGTSSCIVGWEFRANGWDGNGNIIETISNTQQYAKLVCRVNPGFYSWNGLVVWLRGGTAQYSIITDNNIDSIECTNYFLNVGNDVFEPISRENYNNYNNGNISEHSLPNKVNEAPNNGKMYIRKNKAWIEAGMESTMAYWYENNENQSTTTCNRGGNRNVIESLRSKFKRCIAKPYGEDAALISFCNETNSNVWPDGSQMAIDGGRKENRMTYFPKYYHKTVEMSSGVWRTYISEIQLDDDYIEEPEMLLSTFEAFNNNGVLYSGSGVISTGSQTMATFVTQAKSNGPLWGIGDYRSHATIARMFCAYYGNTDISTSNSSIPCSGGTKRYD
nr:MAG TPA: Tail fiber family protein [Bacteriophage sp.]